MKNWIYLSFILFSMSLQAQKLSRDQAKADFAQLKNGIQQYNPALDVYNPDFGSNVNNLITQLDADSISLIEYFSYVSRICALSHEGHFATGNWSDAVHSGFLENNYEYFPVAIKILQGKMFVWKDNSSEQVLNRGDEILALNNLSTTAVISLIEKAISSDGQIKTYALRNIEPGFSWMYYLFVAQPDSFHLKIRDSSGRTKEVIIKALNRDVQFENNDKYYPDPNKNENSEIDAFYVLKQDEDVSYLALPSFDYQKIENYDIKSKRLYKTIFKTIKDRKTRYLVIDLRGNTGGRNELADDMVPYMSKGAIQDQFLKKTISWKGKEKTYKTPNPSKLAFGGNVYVLVNGKTFSAGSILARYLKEYAKATVIGEETGTRYEGFAAGSKQLIILTNSQLRIGIPRYHIFFPQSSKQSTSNRGLLPDFWIDYTLKDLIQNNDLHLDKVNSLIQTDKNTSNKK